MHNLLTEHLIRVRHADGSTSVASLPDVYEAMVSDRVEAFPALRPHQRHAWHAFLAQLAAVALFRAGRTDVPDSAEEWRELIRNLTTDFPGDDPWRLVVDDLAAPGFMQSPAPGGVEEYKKSFKTPDDLDLLVTSKNHDVKASIAVTAEPEDWVFALVSLQTMDGYFGRGSFGIARMNGGHSSRPCLGFAPADGGWGAHLVHDIDQMLRSRSDLLDQYEKYFRSTGGVGLVWVEPWDGKQQLRLRDLDPHFIEICRRVRLDRRGGAIAARGAGSKKTRIAAKAAKGDLGDHWTPVTVGAETKALSVSSAGFRYDRLAKLILDQRAFRHPPAMSTRGSKGTSWRLVARAVARGQGKTEGYHERTDIVFGPQIVRSLLGVGDDRETLEELGRLQISEVSEVVSALRFGIAVAASGGKDSKKIRKSDRAKAAPYARRLEHAADVHFFPALEDRFAVPDEDAAVARRRFVMTLIGQGESLLREATEAVPCAAIQRYRASARATSAFHSRLRRSDVLRSTPDVFERPSVEEGADA